jgi:hypothetical protein
VRKVAIGGRVTLPELQAVIEGVAPAIKEYVARSTADLVARNAVLEQRVKDLESREVQVIHGKDGRDGIDGIDGSKGETGDVGPQGAKGADGADGQAGPEGPAGASGARGERGQDGERGPQGEKGVDGLTGPNGRDGDRGEPGQKGADGRDGVGITGAIIDRDGALIFTMSDGSSKSVGVVVGKDGAQGLNGKDGADGINGRDGVGFDDIDVTLEDGGRVRVERYLRAGQVLKETRLTTGQPVYRGVHKSGDAYAVGDTVTWGGHTWFCQADTTEQPGFANKSEHWVLMTKAGRDGKEGKPGRDGLHGKDGKDGKDGRDKW